MIASDLVPDTPSGADQKQNKMNWLIVKMQQRQHAQIGVSMIRFWKRHVSGAKVIVWVLDRQTLELYWDVDELVDGYVHEADAPHG